MPNDRFPAALLSLDCEFTHGSPMHGRLMSWAAVAVEFNPKTLETGKEIGRLSRDLCVPYWDVHALVSPWVRQNQAELLKKCQGLSLDEDRRSRLMISDWLRSLKSKYGTVYPGGWCMQNDLMYTVKTLAEFADPEPAIHYTGYDIQPMAIALFGPEIAADDDKLCAELDCVRKSAQHDALSDAVFQLQMLQALFERI